SDADVDRQRGRVVADVRCVVARAAGSKNRLIRHGIGGVEKRIAFRAIEPLDVGDGESPGVENFFSFSDCFLQISWGTMSSGICIAVATLGPPGGKELEDLAGEIFAERIILADEKAWCDFLAAA